MSFSITSLKLKLKSKFIALKSKLVKPRDFEHVKFLVGSDLNELSVILEDVDEMDDDGWVADPFGTLFYQSISGDWVEGWFDRDDGFTTL